VKARDHRDDVSADNEVNAVWKSLQENAPCISVQSRERERALLEDRGECGIDRLNEFES